jgi:hypothetical protein
MPDYRGNPNFSTPLNIETMSSLNISIIGLGAMGLGVIIK